MRKQLFLIICMFAFAFGAQAQGQITFQEESFDFGNVKEGDEAVHEFKFTNTGNVPVILSNVHASCGCTTPAWTREPVAPGQSGSIKASYNSKGRPGVFSKTITVTSNAKESSKVLTIKGMVNNEVAPSAEALAKSPKLILGQHAHDFGKVESGQTLKFTTTVTNKGKSDLQIESITSACRCIQPMELPQPLKPGASADITLSYKPTGKGAARDVATIYSNDKHNSKLNIVFSAILVDHLVSESVLKENQTAIPFK